VDAVIIGRHRPHEVMVVIWSAVSALLHFLTPPPPSALDIAYPAWVTQTSYVLLGVGGVVGMVGLLWRGILLSLVLERAGMIAISASTAIYAVAAFYVGGWRALVGGGLIACWSGACAWRAGQITLDLRKLSRGAR
jgi:hypothetical protein